MPTATCQGCGRLTNSAVSDYWDHDRKPTKCKAAFVDGRWVPGCDYGNDADDAEFYGDMFHQQQKEGHPHGD